MKESMVQLVPHWCLSIDVGIIDIREIHRFYEFRTTRIMPTHSRLVFISRRENDCLNGIFMIIIHTLTWRSSLLINVFIILGGLSQHRS